MSGNVRELCWDLLDYQIAYARACRGGSFRDSTKDLWNVVSFVNIRSLDMPYNKSSSDVGFRVVRTVTE